jgi:hypothetical protein
VAKLWRTRIAQCSPAFNCTPRVTRNFHGGANAQYCLAFCRPEAICPCLTRLEAALWSATARSFSLCRIGSVAHRCLNSVPHLQVFNYVSGAACFAVAVQVSLLTADWPPSLATREGDTVRGVDGRLPQLLSNRPDLFNTLHAANVPCMARHTC